VEQGQGDSSSPIPYSMSFAGSQREDREPAGAKQEAKPLDAGLEWPGPLDGPLGYSET